MVTLSSVSASNSLIASTWPQGLVAVFVGATSGIGYYSLKQLVKHSAGTKARVYFIGRNKEAGDRIQAECKKLNPDGEITFIQSDVGLMKNVDEVCKGIKEKEKFVNLLYLSQGAWFLGVDTEEGLETMVAVGYYSRMRFTANLLPLLQAAASLNSSTPNLSRVVSVLTGTKEGKLYTDNDFSRKNVPIRHARGHLSSLTTLTMEHFASQAPEVSFVHSFPGPVKTGIARDAKGAMKIAVFMSTLISPIIPWIPEEESGDRHTFLCTSEMFKGKNGAKDGIPFDSKDAKDKVAVAKGVDGVEGSGVYSTDEYCEAAGPKVVKLLDELKENGLVEKVWEHCGGTFKRITGNEAI